MSDCMNKCENNCSSKSKCSFHIWAITAFIIFLLDVCILAGCVYLYTNKSDIALQSAYGHLADNLNAKIKQDANQTIFVEIFVDDELKKDFTNKRSKDYEEFLVAHYENACFWLNTWLLIMGGLVGIITFIVPLLLARSHEKKMKEIDKDFNLLKDDTKEKIKQADDLNNKTSVILEKAEEAQRKAEEAQRITEKAQGMVEDAQKKIEKAQGIVENAQKKTEEDRKRTEEAQKITEKESKISQFRNGINETYRLIDNKDFDDAKKKLSDLEKLDFIDDKNKAEIKAAYALIYWKNNKLEEAINFYKEAIRLNPHYNYYKCIGIIYRSLNKNELALDALKEAEKLSPNDIQILWQLRRQYKLMGYKKEGNECLDKMKLLSPNNPILGNISADIYLEEGKLDDAKNELTAIIENFYNKTTINQNIYLIYSNLGFVYLLEGNYIEAYNYIEASKNYRPEFSFNLFALALLYIRDKDYKKGMQFLDRFLVRDEMEITYTPGKFVEHRLSEIVSEIVDNNEKYVEYSELRNKLDRALDIYKERTIWGWKQKK